MLRYPSSQAPLTPTQAPLTPTQIPCLSTAESPSGTLRHLQLRLQRQDSVGGWRFPNLRQRICCSVFVRPYAPASVPAHLEHGGLACTHSTHSTRSWHVLVSSNKDGDSCDPGFQVCCDETHQQWVDPGESTCLTQHTRRHPRQQSGPCCHPAQRPATGGNIRAECVDLHCCQVLTKQRRRKGHTMPAVQHAQAVWSPEGPDVMPSCSRLPIHCCMAPIEPSNLHTCLPPLSFKAVSAAGPIIHEAGDHYTWQLIGAQACGTLTGCGLLPGGCPNHHLCALWPCGSDKWAVAAESHHDRVDAQPLMREFT